MNGGVGAGLFAPVGLERVSPGMVIDVASLILGGFHAVPGGTHNVCVTKYYLPHSARSEAEDAAGPPVLAAQPRGDHGRAARVRVDHPGLPAGVHPQGGKH